MKLQIGGEEVSSHFETSILNATDSSAFNSTIPYDIQCILDDKDTAGLETLVLGEFCELGINYCF